MGGYVYGFMIVLLLAALRVARLKSIFGLASFEVFFVLISCVYIYAALIDCVFFGNSKNFRSNYVSFISLMGGFLVFGFYHFSVFLDKVRVNFSLPDSAMYKKNSALVVFILGILFLGLYFYDFYQNLISGLLGSDRAYIYKNKGLLTDVLKLTSVFIIVVTCLVIGNNNERRFSLRLWLFLFFVACFFVVEVFFYGDRRTAVSLLVCLFVIRFYKVSVPRTVIFLGTIIGIFFLVFGVLRNRSLLDAYALIGSENFWAVFNPVNTEFGAFHIVGSKLYSEGFNSIFMLSFFKAPLSLIPESIFPNRPIAPPVWFVKTYFPSIHASGGGVAYNFVMEAFQNFYFMGPFLIGLFVAFLLRISKGATSQRPSLLYLFFGFNILFLMRYDSVTFLRGIVASIMFYLFFVLVAYTFKAFVSRSSG